MWFLGQVQRLNSEPWHKEFELLWMIILDNLNVKYEAPIKLTKYIEIDLHFINEKSYPRHMIHRDIN
ncbi:hypothetical protein CR513_24070, partial [Mucuna pruriens]